MEMTFERVDDGRWYVVMPEYEGFQDDLEMVENADKMLDALTSDGLYVTLDISLEKPSDNDYFELALEAHDEDGAFYNVEGCDRFSGTIWLCNVVHEIFEDHPQRIFCSINE